MNTRKTKPPIDKANAETLSDHPNAGAAPPIANGLDDDPPIAVAENQPPYVYAPQPGIGAKTQMELLMMFVMQLVSGQPPEKGVFRGLSMSAAYFEGLSDQARTHMKQVAAPTPVPSEED